jgi:sugar-specific transcriptional regulator TrmB
MPPRAGDVLDQARSLIEARLRELDGERKRLERSLADLTHGRVGRRRGRRGGTRADQALKIVSDNPGITASEIAKRMRIKPNYVYRVMGELQKDKRVRKRGRGYTAA